MYANYFVTFAIISSLLVFCSCHSSLLFVILSQPTNYFQDKSQFLKDSIESQAKANGVEVIDCYTVEIYRSHVDFADVIGAWAVWPLLPHVLQQVKSKNLQWVFICEDETTVKLVELLKVLKNYDDQKEWFIGHALRDQSSTIIHHYAFAGEDASKFLYPDFAGGFTFSWPLAKKVVDKINNFKEPNFAIDAKHELAMLIWDNGKGVPLTDDEAFCTTKIGSSCATEYRPDYHLCNKYTLSIDDDLLIAVKTFHKHHKTRIVVMKRTWAKESQSIEYYSDVEDKFVPTINLGFENTERGHCGKTMGIIKRFATSDDYENRWLAIVDDDTILSVVRLGRLLRCFDKNDTIIIGERYGYGFSPKGQRGYDYPTGGSGMVFSPSAVNNLAIHCKCPSLDSPDDMILGMCAQHLRIPIVHSAAFHQARPVDYSVDYVNRLKPISFHKHWEIDPYKVYSDYLEERLEHVVDSTMHVHNVEDL